MSLPCACGPVVSLQTGHEGARTTHNTAILELSGARLLQRKAMQPDYHSMYLRSTPEYDTTVGHGAVLRVEIMHALSCILPSYSLAMRCAGRGCNYSVLMLPKFSAESWREHQRSPKSSGKLAMKSRLHIVGHAAASRRAAYRVTNPPVEMLYNPK